MGQNELNELNNNGVAVGEYANYSSKINPPHADVYANFQIQTLFGVPASGVIKLTGINDKNTYVGYGNLPGLPGVSGYMGLYDPANLFSPVVPLNFPGAVATYPYAINNQGTVVGAYRNGIDGLQHGFVFRVDGSFQTLDDPHFLNTTLLGINNVGQIVGSGSSNIFDLPATGFLYSANSFIDLNYGRPLGINDLGAIAVSTANGEGVLYPDGTLAIAYAFTVFSSDLFKVNGLAAINDQGTLIFNSGSAFIATPLASPAPEPSSLALLTAAGLGFAGLCIWRRRYASLV